MDVTDRWSNLEELRMTGMSLRAIAKLKNCSHETVRQHLLRQWRDSQGILCMQELITRYKARLRKK